MVMVIKIDLEKSRENYQAVVDALAEFDIVSAAWETERTTAPVAQSGKTGDDLGANLSAAIGRVSKRQSNE
jgi:hypothetical protein